MSEVFLGQIIQGGWNFAPRGFALCDGSTLPLSQNQALYALLGTQFGGDGVQTFGLPNLIGRAAIGTGTVSGTSYVNGQQVGAAIVTLNLTNLPAHTHTAAFAGSGSLSASTVKATTQVPVANSVLGHSVDTSGGSSTPAIYAPAGSATSAALAGLNVAGTVTVASAGSNAPFSTFQPSLAITTVIAVQGIYPTRS